LRLYYKKDTTEKIVPVFSEGNQKCDKILVNMYGNTFALADRKIFDVSQTVKNRSTMTSLGPNVGTPHYLGAPVTASVT